MLYKVVHRKPMHNLKKVLAVAALLGLSLVVGLLVGQWNGKEAIFQNGALVQQLDTLTEQNQTLQKNLVAAELAVKVQEQAAQELQKKLTGLLSEKVALEDALSFYRDLMEAGDKPEGLRVANFALFATNTPKVFQFSVLITQVAEKRKYVAGDILLKVVGVMNGARQEVIFDAASAVVGFPLRFRFKYFQDLVGQVRLPSDFIPERVSVSVQQNAKNAVTSDFEWSLQRVDSGAE